MKTSKYIFKCHISKQKSVPEEKIRLMIHKENLIIINSSLFTRNLFRLHNNQL